MRKYSKVTTWSAAVIVAGGLASGATARAQSGHDHGGHGASQVSMAKPKRKECLEATLACLLWEVLSHANFCGFYRRVGPRTLAVGPYQGSMGCLRIDFDRGVCGACARTREVQRIDDVHAFPGHIACDPRSRSELVVPVVAGGELRAVLDVDSPHLAAFSAAEADRVHALVRRTFDRAGVVF